MSAALTTDPSFSGQWLQLNLAMPSMQHRLGFLGQVHNRTLAASLSLPGWKYRIVSAIGVPDLYLLTAYA